MRGSHREIEDDNLDLVRKIAEVQLELHIEGREEDAEEA
jgi:hypothetical protein